MYSDLFLSQRTLHCWAGVALKKRKSVQNTHIFALIAEKKASNLAMHIGKTMIFTGILEGVWPVNNSKQV